MEESGPGGRKLDLAKSGAARAVTYLKPSDKVAVITFTATGNVQVPLTEVSQQEKNRVCAASFQLGQLVRLPEEPLREERQ